MVKKIKKKKFRKPYIFYSILVFLGIVLAFFFIYGVTSSKSKISGRVVLEDYIDEASCIVAGYIWENLINETCTNVTICVNETINCEPCLEYEDINRTQRDCINWSFCINETCIDEENCSEIIIGGRCIGSEEENAQDEIKEEVKEEPKIEAKEEITNSLTDEERKILVEKFGDVAVKITKAELVNERIFIRYELGDYWFEPSYDSDLSEKDLKLQMESERIKWLKDITNVLLQKKINPEKIEGFIGDYSI